MSCERENCTASNKFGIFLVVLYIVYLSIGAAVFQALETPKELQKCDAARKNVLDKVDMLGTEYFFTFGLNVLTCDGIKAVLAEKKRRNRSAIEVLRSWKDTNCSRVGFAQLEADLHRNFGKSGFKEDYDELWKEAFVRGMPHDYLTQSVSIKRKELAELLTKAAHFSISNYQQLQSKCHGGNLRWDYHNAFFFAGSLASTIGYGNVYPETFGGKVFCIFFIAFGIPYFGYMLSVISELIHLNLRRVSSLRIRHRKSLLGSSGDKSKCIVDFSTAFYVIIGSALLVVLPSYGLTLVEGWSFFDSIYYSLITLTTVGIGDFVPSILPPDKFAIYVRNDTSCFEALVDPINNSNRSLDTGMPIACNQTEWSEAVQLCYSWYRVLVFCWILIGLAWLGGIIQMISDNLRIRPHNPANVLITECRDFRKTDSRHLETKKALKTSEEDLAEEKNASC